MINSNCCICGTVRNCGPYLEKVLQNIETIGNIFKHYKIIIAYDESSDNSLQILQNYQNIHSDNFILYIGTEPLNPYRVQNIARARNKCLDIFKTNFHQFEYFINQFNT